MTSDASMPWSLRYARAFSRRPIWFGRRWLPGLLAGSSAQWLRDQWFCGAVEAVGLMRIIELAVDAIDH
jgi:hypothetical protein